MSKCFLFQGSAISYSNVSSIYYCISESSAATRLRLAVADPAGVVRAAPALDGGDVRQADAQAVRVVRARALVAAHQVAAVPAHLAQMHCHAQSACVVMGTLLPLALTLVRRHSSRVATRSAWRMLWPACPDGWQNAVARSEKPAQDHPELGLCRATPRLRTSGIDGHYWERWQQNPVSETVTISFRLSRTTSHSCLRTWHVEECS